MKSQKRANFEPGMQKEREIEGKRESAKKDKQIENIQREVQKHEDRMRSSNEYMIGVLKREL